MYTIYNIILQHVILVYVDLRQYTYVYVYTIYIIIYIHTILINIVHVHMINVSTLSQLLSSGPTTPGRGRRSNGRSGCSQRRGEEGQLATETRWISVGSLGPWRWCMLRSWDTQLIKLLLYLSLSIIIIIYYYLLSINYEYLLLSIYLSESSDSEFWIQNSRFTDGTFG